MVDAGADAVKLEGRLPDIIKAITKAGIPVMGHLGLLPQTAKGYRVQGTTKKGKQVLLEDAKALQEAGCFSIVFEMVTADTMYAITEAVSVPTIGIGCGKDCDGQVLVIHDMLGLFEKFQPSFVKRYLSLSEQIRKAVAQYVKDVEDVTFPTKHHSFYSVPERPTINPDGMSLDGYFGGGIEFGFERCCIFFFIYCRSIFDHSYEDSGIWENASEDLKRFYANPHAQIIDKKLQEEQDNILSEMERIEWFEGIGECWMLKDGYIRCPDCIAKELKRRKMTNTLNQFREFQPRFLKE